MPYAEIDFWVDPDPESTGILLSDRIEYYVDKVKLIDPFDRRAMGPASYTLHAGSDFLLNNKYGNLEKDGSVEIPPNGLIYIRFYEEVNIPHYMIARFNLRVKQVYRGLLLGTGPQVDPGFKGHLNCPIHNFTADPKLISFRDPLVTIDFEKTTYFGHGAFQGKEVSEVCSVIEKAKLHKVSISGFSGIECVLFDKPSDRPLREYLPQGESVKSSIYDLHKRVERYERIFFWTAIVAGFGVAGIIITAFSINYALYSSLESNFFSSYRDLKEDVRHLSGKIGRLGGLLEGLSSEKEGNGVKSFSKGNSQDRLENLKRNDGS